MSKLRKYRFATDAENGYMEAPHFAAACSRLDALLSDAPDGACGWVEDQDGYRYEVACDPETVARVTAAYQRLARVLGIS